MSLLSAKHSSLLSDEETPCDRRFGEPFKGPIIPFGSIVKYQPILCQRLVATASVWHDSFTRNIHRLCIIRCYVWYAGESWKGDSMVEDTGIGKDGRI